MALGPVGHGEPEFRLILGLLEKFQNDEIIGKLLNYFKPGVYDVRPPEFKTLDIFSNGVMSSLLYAKIIVLGKLIHNNLYEIYCRDKTIMICRNRHGGIDLLSRQPQG